MKTVSAICVLALFLGCCSPGPSGDPQSAAAPDTKTETKQCGSANTCPTAAKAECPSAKKACPSAEAKSDLYLGEVQTLDGKKVALCNYMPDHKIEAPNAVAVPDYVLLVVAQTSCEWSRQMVEELEPHLAELGKLKVRTVAVLNQRGGSPVSEWAPMQKKGLILLEDKSGDCYKAYVKQKTPSVHILDNSSKRLLTLEGYLEPGKIVEKIRNKDFKATKTKGG